MTAIRSPLGALGALMVFLQGILAGAVVAVRDIPLLATILVIAMVALTSVVTLTILGVIVWFAHKSPALLYNPSDLSPDIHDPNTTTISYSCSKGHKWTEGSRGSCWCGYPNSTVANAPQPHQAQG